MTMSDCHPDVLDTLQKNVEINFFNKSEPCIDKTIGVYNILILVIVLFCQFSHSCHYNVSGSHKVFLSGVIPYNLVLRVVQKLEHG